MDRLLKIPVQTWSYIEPHPAQQQIINSIARYRVLACGRRFGKTDLGIYQLGNESQRTGLPYAYFAPTYKMLSDVWRSFKAALGNRIIYKNEMEKRIELTSGGSIDFWSLDNSNAARGRKYAGIVIDEAAFVPDLEYAWTFVIAPTLTDYRGWAWFLSTPNGRNYFFRLWSMGQDYTKKSWESWQFPTKANPYINSQEIDERRELLPERTFRQEYLAEFVEDGGAVFRNLGACIGPLYGCSVEVPNLVAGLDWGKDNDFTVIVLIDADTGAVLALDHFNEIGWRLQRGRLRAFYDRYQPRVIVAEQNSIGDPNIEELQAEGLPIQPFMTTAQSKGPLIESLALAFERGEITIPDDPVLMGELQAYSMERLSSGRFRYEAPAGMHDDCVIALALAWHAANVPTRLLDFV